MKGRKKNRRKILLKRYTRKGKGGEFEKKLIGKRSSVSAKNIER